MPSTVHDRVGSLSLILFVSGTAPNSMGARENLRRLLSKLEELGVDVELEVQDVEEDPQLAITEGIFVTPALRVVGLNRRHLIFGDRSDEDGLRSAFPEVYS